VGSSCDERAGSISGRSITDMPDSDLELDFEENAAPTKLMMDLEGCEDNAGHLHNLMPPVGFQLTFAGQSLGCALLPAARGCVGCGECHVVTKGH